MSVTIEKLHNFIEHARRLGKYPKNTAVGHQAALKVVEQGLLPDEPSDLQYIADHLEEIYHRQSEKHSLSAASIETYIARVKRVISDYDQYGTDPKAMLAWKPRILQRGPRKRTKETPSGETRPPTQPMTGTTLFPSAPNGLKILVWSLRPDLNIQIQLPRDLTGKDVERLTKLLKLEAELSESP